MTGRLFMALAALGGAGSAVAQGSPDSTRPVVIFSDILVSGAPAFVVLAQGTAYRVEVVPAGTTISIRAAGRPTAPPLVLQPLEDAAVVEGGVTFLVVPDRSAEYRIEAPTASEAVRVRIVRDPRETRLLAGQGRPPRALTAGLRAVGMVGRIEVVRTGPFPGAVGQASADTAVKGSAVGVEACFGVRPGRFRPLPRVGGYLLTVGVYHHSQGAELLLVGAAPHLVLSARGRSVQMALAGHLAVGKASEPFRRNAVYLVAGAGLSMSRVIGRFQIEVVPGLAVVQRGAYTRATAFGAEQVGAAVAFAPRLSAGAQLSL